MSLELCIAHSFVATASPVNHHFSFAASLLPPPLSGTEATVMAVLSSLAHVLREAAGRAIAHARPPGGIGKPKGGVPGAKYVGSVRQLSCASPASPFRHTHASTAASSSQTSSPLSRALSSLFEHAIAPVFVGIGSSPTAQMQANAVVRSKVRSALSDMTKPRSFKPGFGKPAFRPTLGPNGTTRSEPRSVASVGLRLADSYKFSTGVPHMAFSPVADLAFAPGLGLRALADELEDRLKESSKRKRENLSQLTGARRFGSDPFLYPCKEATWNVARYLTELDSVATPSATVSVISLSELGDSELSVSTSVMGALEMQADLQLMASSWATDIASSEAGSIEQETASVQYYFQTTLRVPLTPNLYDLGDQEDVGAATHAASSGLLDGVMRLTEAFNSHQLQVIRPLEHAMLYGRLSTLRPQGWDGAEVQLRRRSPGQPDEGFLEVTFFDSDADQVMACLRQDVSPQLYYRLVDFIWDDVVDARGRPVGEGEDYEETLSIIAEAEALHDGHMDEMPAMTLRYPVLDVVPPAHL